MGLRAKDSKGEIVSSPTLDLVLTYDYQVRKLMVKLMNDGVEMSRALEQAMGDTTVKERFFLTPAALDAAAQSARDPGRKSRSPRREHSREEGWYGGSNRSSKGWKKGGKGKSKGSNKGRLHTKTPDGRDICFAWNNKDQRCRFNCGRVHCCQICFGSHPAHSCKSGQKSAQQSDTAGAGKEDK